MSLIIRVTTQGQYRVESDVVDELNSIDNELEAAVEANDEEAFAAALARIHDLVASKGTPVEDEELVESDVILPDTDSTIAEVKEILNDDGLIPG